MPKVKSTDDVGSRIVKLKDVDGKTWSEISDTVGLPQGKCMFKYAQATVTPKTKITGRNDEELKARIAKGRDDGISWGVLAARSGKSEGFCKAAFQEITGQQARGHRIGKGGRYPGDATEGATKVKGVKAPKAAKAVKKASKAAPAKKAPAKKAVPAKKATGAVKKVAKKVAKAAA